MKNLLLLGDLNLEDYARDIWKYNTEYAIVSCQDLNFVINDKIIYEKPKYILLSNASDFKSVDINSFISFIKKNKLLPVFISEGYNSFARLMMTNIGDHIRDSIIYFINDEKKDYDNLIKYCASFILKGHKDDKIIRTSRRREKKTS